MKDAVSADSIFSYVDHEVFLVTTHDAGCDAGQIATWIMPATLIPDHPRIVVIFSPANFTYELIQSSRRFVIQLLANGQHELLPRFGLTSSRTTKKFEGLEITRTKSGLPIVSGTCGWAECQWLAELDSGDRRIVLARVLDQHIVRDQQPLLKNAAFKLLPKEEACALANKRLRDGERDRDLMRIF